MYPDAENLRAQNYYGCVTAMDEQIGRLRRTLKRLDVADNTLITFCSDNGPEGNSSAPGSAGPFRGRKRSLYEGGIREPFLIRAPGVTKPSSTSDAPACDTRLTRLESLFHDHDEPDASSRKDWQ